MLTRLTSAAPSSTAAIPATPQGFRSLLTDSEDASYLFNAVLDGVVDHAMPVVNVRVAGHACQQHAPAVMPPCCLA